MSVRGPCGALAPEIRTIVQHDEQEGVSSRFNLDKATLVRRKPRHHEDDDVRYYDA